MSGANDGNIQWNLVSSRILTGYCSSSVIFKVPQIIAQLYHSQFCHMRSTWIIIPNEQHVFTSVLCCRSSPGLQFLGRPPSSGQNWACCLLEETCSSPPRAAAAAERMAAMFSCFQSTNSEEKSHQMFDTVGVWLITAQHSSHLSGWSLLLKMLKWFEKVFPPLWILVNITGDHSVKVMLSITSCQVTTQHQ